MTINHRFAPIFSLLNLTVKKKTYPTVNGGGESLDTVRNNLINDRSFHEDANEIMQDLNLILGKIETAYARHVEKVSNKLDKKNIRDELIVKKISPNKFDYLMLSYQAKWNSSDPETFNKLKDAVSEFLNQGKAYKNSYFSALSNLSSDPNNYQLLNAFVKCIVSYYCNRFKTFPSEPKDNKIQDTLTRYLTHVLDNPDEFDTVMRGIKNDDLEIDEPFVFHAIKDYDEHKHRPKKVKKEKKKKAKVESDDEEEF